jgi:hypothetical protein
MKKRFIKSKKGRTKHKTAAMLAHIMISKPA